MNVSSITRGLKNFTSPDLSREQKMNINFILVRGGSIKNKVSLLEAMNVPNPQELIESYTITDARRKLASNSAMEVAGRKMGVMRVTAENLKSAILSAKPKTPVMTAQRFSQSILTMLEATVPETKDAWRNTTNLLPSLKLRQQFETWFEIYISTGILRELLRSGRQQEANNMINQVLGEVDQVIENFMFDPSGLSSDSVVLWEDDEGEWRRASAQDFENELEGLIDDINRHLDSVLVLAYNRNIDDNGHINYDTHKFIQNNTKEWGTL